MAVHVVLYEPEIPQNTGNVIRTCVACGVTLHLIEPLGFDLMKKHIRRSTTNHLENARIETHANFEAFAEKNPGEYFYLTRYGKRPHSSFEFGAAGGDRDIYLIFARKAREFPMISCGRILIGVFGSRCRRNAAASTCRTVSPSSCTR